MEDSTDAINGKPKEWRIKVCGMTQLDQVDQLAEFGVTFAGFIFYPKSPRYVFRHMTITQLKKENNINKVGVFVNTPIDEVLHMVDDCRLHMVQLHGDESPKYCEKLADYVSVVKAFRLSEGENIEYMIYPYMEVCDMFMFDTMGAGYGGTGKKFDWNVLKSRVIGKPFFLSGGIQPEDVAELRAFSKEPVANALFAIDINSRFELSPGVKDMEKVKIFCKELH
ncbi:MAG TPA: phosphoribosylanthranilate isomerase [Flavitalea sp.]|nr:phosphoribosylanthranilate isomerase [Flavitalea sp.]